MDDQKSLSNPCTFVVPNITKTIEKVGVVDYFLHESELYEKTFINNRIGTTDLYNSKARIRSLFINYPKKAYIVAHVTGHDKIIKNCKKTGDEKKNKIVQKVSNERGNSYLNCLKSLEKNATDTEQNEASVKPSYETLVRVLSATETIREYGEHAKKVEELPPSKFENFKQTCEVFKVKLEEYKNNNNNKCCEHKSVSELINQIDDVVNLSRKLEKTGVVTTHIDQFVRTCEQFKKHLKSSDKDVPPSEMICNYSDSINSNVTNICHHMRRGSAGTLAVKNKDGSKSFRSSSLNLISQNRLAKQDDLGTSGIMSNSEEDYKTIRTITKITRYLKPDGTVQEDKEIVTIKQSPDLLPEHKSKTSHKETKGKSSLTEDGKQTRLDLPNAITEICQRDKHNEIKHEKGKQHDKNIKTNPPPRICDKCAFKQNKNIHDDKTKSKTAKPVPPLTPNCNCLDIEREKTKQIPSSPSKDVTNVPKKVYSQDESHAVKRNKENKHDQSEKPKFKICSLCSAKMLPQAKSTALEELTCTCSDIDRQMTKLTSSSPSKDVTNVPNKIDPHNENNAIKRNKENNDNTKKPKSKTAYDICRLCSAKMLPEAKNTALEELTCTCSDIDRQMTKLIPKSPSKDVTNVPKKVYSQDESHAVKRNKENKHDHSEKPKFKICSLCSAKMLPQAKNTALEELSCTCSDIDRQMTKLTSSSPIKDVTNVPNKIDPHNENNAIKRNKKSNHDNTEKPKSKTAYDICRLCSAKMLPQAKSNPSLEALSCTCSDIERQSSKRISSSSKQDIAYLSKKVYAHDENNAIKRNKEINNHGKADKKHFLRNSKTTDNICDICSAKILPKAKPNTSLDALSCTCSDIERQISKRKFSYEYTTNIPTKTPHDKANAMKRNKENNNDHFDNKPKSKTHDMCEMCSANVFPKSQPHPSVEALSCTCSDIERHVTKRLCSSSREDITHLNANKRYKKNNEYNADKKSKFQTTNDLCEICCANTMPKHKTKLAVDASFSNLQSKENLIKHMKTVEHEGERYHKNKRKTSFTHRDIPNLPKSVPHDKTEFLKDHIYNNNGYAVDKNTKSKTAKNICDTCFTKMLPIPKSEPSFDAISGVSTNRHRHTKRRISTSSSEDNKYIPKTVYPHGKTNAFKRNKENNSYNTEKLKTTKDICEMCSAKTLPKSKTKSTIESSSSCAIESLKNAKHGREYSYKTTRKYTTYKEIPTICPYDKAAIKQNHEHNQGHTLDKKTKTYTSNICDCCSDHKPPMSKSKPSLDASLYDLSRENLMTKLKSTSSHQYSPHHPKILHPREESCDFCCEGDIQLTSTFESKARVLPEPCCCIPEYTESESIKTSGKQQFSVTHLPILESKHEKLSKKIADSISIQNIPKSGLILFLNKKQDMLSRTCSTENLTQETCKQIIPKYSKSYLPDSEIILSLDQPKEEVTCSCTDLSDFKADLLNIETASIGLFENRIRVITRVTRYLDANSNVQEKREVITIKEEISDPGIKSLHEVKDESYWNDTDVFEIIKGNDICNRDNKKEQTMKCMTKKRR